MNHPKYAAELVQLLQADQAEKREAGQVYWHADDKTAQESMQALKQKTRQRTRRMLEILDAISEPSISNIGPEAAKAISVLGLHDNLDVMKRVLAQFNTLYERDPNNTYYQAIPSMTDFVLILEGKPQRFGTQWLFDKNKQPYLPTVEDFERVNERRAKYGIEPLRWPKSLAIPESEQTWLKRPLTELVMREPTAEELKDLTS